MVNFIPREINHVGLLYRLPKFYEDFPHSEKRTKVDIIENSHILK